MTGQPISIVMRISFSTKANHPDQSNPKYYAQRRWFLSKTSWIKLILLPKCLVRPWSVRPVLTFGKRPKKTTRLHYLDLNVRPSDLQPDPRFIYLPDHRPRRSQLPQGKLSVLQTCCSKGQTSHRLTDLPAWHVCG